MPRKNQKHGRISYGFTPERGGGSKFGFLEPILFFNHHQNVIEKYLGQLTYLT